MKRPVQVAGAVVTSGLLFWPAHAEAPAADEVGVPTIQLASATLPLHDVRTTAGRPAEQRLRVLAQYTEEEPVAAEGDDESEDTSDTTETAIEDEASADEEASFDDGAAETAAEGAEVSAPVAGDDPFATLEPSDAVNEVPVTAEPEPTEATWAPEEPERVMEGEAAADAAGDDSRVKFKVSTGFDYSSGDYGITDDFGNEVDTDILFIPVAAQIDTRSWKFKVTVPWIRIEGPTGVVGGTDGPIVVDDPVAPVIVENSGLGDVVGAVTFKVPPLGDGAPFIDLTGKVKFPTADPDKFLGTGEFDFTAQADVFQAFGDLTIFGTIGYRILGDPDGRDLNNGVLAGGGLAYKFSDSFSGGGILDWREASTDTSDDPFEVVPYVVFKFHDDWALQAYGVFGLSDGSPDAGGGLQLTVTFD